MEPKQTKRLLQVREDITLVEVEGEAVIYDPRLILLHHLNSTASIIFQLCDGSGTTEELAEDIADVAGVPLDQVRQEVIEVVARFDEMQILTDSPFPEQEGSNHG